MKKLFTIVFLSFLFNLHAQDTLVIKKDTILCKITRVTSMNIFYTENKVGKSIAISDVSYYSKPKTIQQEIKTPVFEMKTKDVKISDELFYMRESLARYHKQYATGMVFYGLGVAVAIAGIAVKPDNYTGVAIATGVLTLTGSIIIVDSHKWIKRTSIGVGGKGVKVNYTF